MVSSSVTQTRQDAGHLKPSTRRRSSSTSSDTDEEVSAIASCEDDEAISDEYITTDCDSEVSRSPVSTRDNGEGFEEGPQSVPEDREVPQRVPETVKRKVKVKRRGPQSDPELLSLRKVSRFRQPAEQLSALHSERCLYVDARIGSIRSRVSVCALIDSGSSGDFISKKLC